MSQPPSHQQQPRPTRADRVAARGARVWIPVGLVLAGIVVALVWSVGLGLAFLVAAGVAVVADLWIRLGISSQDDRDDEARARRYFARRGRWPRG